MQLLKPLLLFLLAATLGFAADSKDVDFHKETQGSAWALRHFLKATAPSFSSDYLEQWRPIAKREKLYWRIDCGDGAAGGCIGFFQRVPVDGPENNTCGYWAFVGETRQDIAYGFVESINTPDTWGQYLHPPPAPPKKKSKATTLLGYPDKPEEESK